MSDIKTVDITIDAEYEEYTSIHWNASLISSLQKQEWRDFLCNIYLLLLTYDCDIVEDTDFDETGCYESTFRVSKCSNTVESRYLFHLKVNQKLLTPYVYDSNKTYQLSDVKLNNRRFKDMDSAWEYFQQILDKLVSGNEDILSAVSCLLERGELE